MGSGSLVNVGSGNGLLPDVTQTMNWFWFAINEIIWHSFLDGIYLNTQDFNPQIVFEIYTFEMMIVSSREQWVKLISFLNNSWSGQLH